MCFYLLLQTMLSIHQILKKYWGFDEFRPQQADIINSIIQGHDTLALLPTGGGKSICFQVPALASEGICLVVSPLVALMKDQVQNLEKVQVKAAYLHSGMRKREIDITLDNAVYGHFKFLYVSPERLKTDIFIERFKKMHVGLIAIDEAHCISQWGHDFRPSYLQIAELRDLQPKVPCIALTGTATSAVCADIVKYLAFKAGHNTFKKSFDRQNLVYAVTHTNDKQSRILFALRKTRGSAILYVQNRRQCRSLAHWLVSQGISADFYHAGLSGLERNQKQEAWIQNKARIMVCTNAFGMGIDKPDVRLVMHYSVPSSPEAYYQEAGRAGRDGQKAYAILLANQADEDQLLSQAQQAIPPIEIIKRVYQALGNYFQLAIGHGAGVSRHFDLLAFASHFNLKPTEALSSIKLLEKQGFIAMSEAFYQPSRVMIKVNQADLYAFKVANAGAEPIINALLRVYPGLFEQYVNIIENILAKLLQLSATAVKKQLRKLAEYELIDYQEAHDKPMITFIEDRQDAQHLHLDRAFLQSRREVYEKQARSMIDYLHAPACRTKILLEYFGEKPMQNCGHCDDCLEENTPGDRTVEDIMALLPIGKSLPLDELKQQIRANSTEVQKVIGYLLDEGIIEMSNGKVQRATS